MGRRNEESRGHRGSDRDAAESRSDHRHHHHRRRRENDDKDHGDDKNSKNDRGKGNHRRHRHSHHESSSSSRRHDDGGGRDDARNSADRSSRRRPRTERRDRRHGEDGDGSVGDRSDVEDDRRTGRRHHKSRRGRGDRHYDDNSDGDSQHNNNSTNGHQRGRKRGRDGRGDRNSDSDREDVREDRRGRSHRDRGAAEEASGGGSGGGGSSRETRCVASSRDNNNSSSSNGYVGSTAAVDWSSRRGRRQMPAMAYDATQHRRLLGFLDHREGNHSAAVKFEIGADGLVQMPPPNTLVRRLNNRQQQPPSCKKESFEHRWAAYTSMQEKSDGDKDSVASHESLYDDPSAEHRGVLSDISPPSDLFRVVLYGVELAVTSTHLRSLIVQLLGKAATPYRVRRPAREMLEAAMAYNTSVASSAAAAPAAPSASSSTPAPTKSAGDGVLSAAPLPGVLPDEEGVAGVLSFGGPDDNGSEGEAEEKEGVLPDASSLPVPPPPAVPALYLPGLHNVNGPGGMVVLEFAEQEHAMRTVQVLNGGFINGRRVAASM